MNILYFGKICEEDLFKKREKKEQPFFIAQYMFEKALCNNLKNNNQLDIASIYQTEYFPKGNLFFNRKKGENNISYLKFINIPYLRELTYFISACLFILIWFIKNRRKDELCIYSSCHFPPVSLAIVFMGEILSVKKIITFTDLSIFTYSGDKVRNMKFYKRILMRPYIGIVNKLQESYDAYILFSKEMNQIVNMKNRPYLVMEGIYNSQHLNFEESTNKANAIAHAGTLNREVGIETILDVFSLIEDQNLELWFFGKGDMTEEILQRADKDKRIKYLGFLPRNIVFDKLKEAKLLVNFRNPNDIYTKYSFPSKMFEYMASGTPVLTTKLSGIPEEYYNYIYSIDSNDTNELKNKIEYIFKIDEADRKKVGIKARNYVIRQKNGAMQAKKIEDFLRSFCGK